MILPREWWRLSLHWLFPWLFNSDRRESQAKPRLFQNSVLWASLGLSVGIGALSVTLAITTGFENTLAKIVATAQGDLVHYTRWLKEAELDEIAKLAYQQNPAPRSVQYFWKSHGLIVGKRAGRGVLIEGSSEASSTKRPPLEEGENALPILKMGQPLAEYLGVQVGDQVRLLLPGMVKGSIPFRITEVLSFGMYEIDSRYISVDSYSLREWLKQNEPESFVKRPGDAFAIRYLMDEPFHKVSNQNLMTNWMAGYQKSYIEKYPQDPGPEIQPWWVQRRNLFGSIDLDKNLLTLIVSLLVLVSTLNVAATLVILFLERDRDLAILRALGLSRGQLVQWTGVIGLIVGTMASGFGILLGRVIGWVLTQLPWARLPAEVYRISELPLDFVYPEQFFVFLFGILATTVAALLLGFRLSKQSFLEVLGHRL
jgi:lipoprotein-releasing system permease protein